MRIAVVSNTAWYLYNFRLNLMRALREAGHSIVAVAPADAYTQRICEEGIVFEAIAINGGGTNPLTEARSVVAIWRMLRRQKIDLVLSYTPKGNLYSAMACVLRRIPFVPNVSGLGRAFIRQSPVTWITRALYRLTFRRAHRVFFQNVEDRDTFIAGGLVLPRQAERLPGSGVDLNRFVAERPVDRQPGCAVFLLVARMLWDKGVGEFVHAARSIRMVYPKARFQLLGFLDVANPSAISRDQMDTWVANGDVEYLGQTDDVRPILIQADCVVLPSKYREGVPRTLLEAAATARPVVTTDAPGCRDTVVDNRSGYLCKPGDAFDLTEKLLQFMALTVPQRTALGVAGREHVEAHFDERIVVQRYLHVVAQIDSDLLR